MSNVRGLVGMLCFLAIAGCSDDDFEPIVQKQSRLLGGGGGNGSKKWVLVSGAASSINFPSTDLDFETCFSDNVYTFQNNASQDYNVAEGSSKCSSFDTNTTEKGSWALTLDGKSIIIHANEVPSEQYTFGYVQAKIIELTDTSFKISFEGGSNPPITYTLTFEVMP